MTSFLSLSLRVVDEFQIHPNDRAQLARALVDECRTDPNTTLGLRDCALSLIGFAGAFRRSELVRISVADLEWKTQGVEIALPWSKIDQEGKGQVKYITRG